MMEVRVRIKPLAHVTGREELVVLPLAESGRFVLGLNFYEDVERGRRGRLVLVEDKLGMLREVKVVEGDRVFVEVYGAREALEAISRLIRLERITVGRVIPLFINPEFRSEARSASRGVTGYSNYVAKFGVPDVTKLRGVITLSVEEVLQS